MRSIAAALAATLLSACGHPLAGSGLAHPLGEASSDAAVVFVSSECTGTLIARDAVLTAAHCVEERSPWSVWVGGRERVAVTRCAVHPLAYGRPTPCGAGPAGSGTRPAHDLAVLRLERPVTAARPLPVLLAPPSLSPAWWHARTVRLVGWHRRPALVGALERLSGPNQIVGHDGATFVTAPASPGGPRTRIGDSGGPALLQHGGAEAVVGVLFGGLSRGSPESVYAATDAPLNASWLVRTLGGDFGRDLGFASADAPWGLPQRSRSRIGSNGVTASPRSR